MYKKTVISLLFSGVMINTALTASADNIIPFSYSDDPFTGLNVWGNGKAETISVAIRVDDTSLAGSRLHKISVPVFVNDYVGDYKVWASTNLETEVVDNKRVNKPEYGNFEVTLPSEVDEKGIGVLEYVFDEEIPINDNGLYVGYTFTVSDGKKLPKPIVVKPYLAHDGAFLLQSSRTDLKWTDYSTQLYCISPMILEFIGDFEVSAAGIQSAVVDYAGADAQHSIPVMLVSRGTMPIENIEYTATVGDKTISGKLETDPGQLSSYGATQHLELLLPQQDRLGVHDITISVDKVNGVVNNDSQKEVAGQIEIIKHRPVYKPLMEEFTGTGCPQCTRGLAALDKMNELHGDRFVAISYHGYNSNDPMVMAAGYPMPAVILSGFPAACLNRTLRCDPYWGSKNTEFGIESDWQSLADNFSPVEISLDARWEDARKEIINISSSVSWAVKPEDGEYSMAYVLVADDLHGTGKEWIQSNALAGSSEHYRYLEDFIDGKYGQAVVQDYHFNDVAILTSEHAGIAGSIPFVSTEEKTEHKYSFNLRDAVNVSGNEIFQNKDKLRVVAMVLKADSSIGTVVNCETVHVDGFNSVEDVASDGAAVVSEQWYDITGKRVGSASENGIYIHVVEFSDGTVKKSKLCVK